MNIFEHKGTFFKILSQTPLSQVGVMTVPAGRDAGPMETHTGDQVFYIVEGEATVTVDGETSVLKAGDVTTVPKDTPHHVLSSGKESLFFLTVYTPPQY